MEQNVKRWVMAGAAVVTAMAPIAAHAAVDLTGVTLDTATPQTLAATVLGGLGIIWGIRKLVKLINRS